MQFWWPLKNPGAHWYERDERYAGRNEDPILAPQWNHKKTLLFLAPKTGRVLDIGCGVGNFLAHATAKGWQGAGIDFDRDAIEAGEKTFGLENLEVADIVSYAREYVGEKFDLITFFDVLEHIDDHKEFMAAVRELLKDGGHIAITVPHRSHAQWLMPADLPPRHLTRWHENSLKAFLEREGFTMAHMQRSAASIPFIIQKLRFRFGRAVSIGLVKKARTPSSRKVALSVARLKDIVLFGLPALALWLLLLPTKKRYIGLYAIASLPAGRQESVIETKFGRFAIDEAADAKMAKKLRGHFPQRELFKLIDHLNPKRIVDVGAHIGTVSVPLAKNYNVIAFEPNPASFRYLQRNAELNQVSLDARNKGLSDTAGRAQSVARHGGNAGAHTLAEGDEVEISTLDAEVAQADFIKIDVEGMELFVLRGGKKLIERSRPAIYFEVNLFALRAHKTSLKSLTRFFKSFGYRLYFPDGKLYALPALSLAAALITPRSLLFGGPAAPFDILALPKEHSMPTRSVLRTLMYLIVRYFKSQYARFY